MTLERRDARHWDVKVWNLLGRIPIVAALTAVIRPASAHGRADQDVCKPMTLT